MRKFMVGMALILVLACDPSTVIIPQPDVCTMRLFITVDATDTLYYTEYNHTLWTFEPPDSMAPYDTLYFDTTDSIYVGEPGTGPCPVN